MLSIGVDIGTVNGSIAVIDDQFNIRLLTKAPYVEKVTSKTANNRLKPKIDKETGKLVDCYRTRKWTDYTKFRDMFSPFVGKKSEILYTMERVSVRPMEGEIHSFIFGNSLGCFQGLSAYLNPLRIYEPTPQEWKGSMGLTSNKEESVKLAEKIFEVDLRQYLPKGKLDDIAEALLLAVYGLKQYYDETNGG